MEANAVGLASQEKQSLMSKRISELEKEIGELKNWDRKAERYQLHEISPGLYGYSIKPGMEGGEPFHMLCANCFKDRKPSILQLISESTIDREFLCHDCKLNLTIPKDKLDRPEKTKDPKCLAKSYRVQ